jgi:O-antigen ligase
MGLNIKSLPELWKNHKFKIIVLVAALLTTKSTTGYLVFFAIVFFYLLFVIKNPLVKFALIPTLLLAIGFVYANTDFLQDKIEAQTERTETLAKGEFINSRFGSFKLDMHYVQKHPLVGNGLHEKTRYADDPQLIQLIETGGQLGNGNGFSNYLACMGIPFMAVYLLMVFNTINRVDTKTAFLIMFVILLSLWGEQWLQYPLYTGLVFINIKKYFNDGTQHRSFNHLPQS